MRGALQEPGPDATQTAQVSALQPRLMRNRCRRAWSRRQAPARKRKKDKLILTDADSQTDYESFAAPDGTAGYRVETEEASGWLYLNPSGGSDDGNGTVFVYWGNGPAQDPELDTPISHIDVGMLLSGEREPHDACRAPQEWQPD